MGGGGRILCFHYLICVFSIYGDPQNRLPNIARIWNSNEAFSSGIGTDAEINSGVTALSTKSYTFPGFLLYIPNSKLCLLFKRTWKKRLWRWVGGSSDCQWSELWNHVTLWQAEMWKPLSGVCFRGYRELALSRWGAFSVFIPSDHQEVIIWLFLTVIPPLPNYSQGEV